MTREEAMRIGQMHTSRVHIPRNRIPEEIKQDVIDTVDSIQPFKPNISVANRDYLFEVYNKYVNPTHNEDIESGCSDCLLKVVGSIELIVKGWKAKEETTS
jgi:hypothetical protein